MDFLQKLDRLMSDRNMNKHVLSRESGIPYTTIIGLYQKNSNNIKLTTIQKLSSYFGVSIDYLVDKTERSISIKPSTPAEQTLIYNYRILDEHGKNVVDKIIEMELDRIKSSPKK